MADKIQRLLSHNAIVKNHERFFFRMFRSSRWMVDLPVSKLVIETINAV